MWTLLLQPLHYTGINCDDVNCSQVLPVGRLVKFGDLIPVRFVALRNVLYQEQFLPFLAGRSVFLAEELTEPGSPPTKNYIFCRAHRLFVIAVAEGGEAIGRVEQAPTEHVLLDECPGCMFTNLAYWVLLHPTPFINDLDLIGQKSELVSGFRYGPPPCQGPRLIVAGNLAANLIRSRSALPFLRQHALEKFPQLFR